MFIYVGMTWILYLTAWTPKKIIIINKVLLNFDTLKKKKQSIAKFSYVIYDFH